MSSEKVHAAIKRVLGESMKTVVKSVKKPSAYIVFTKAKRTELMFDEPFLALKTQEKMKHLAGLWKGLDDAGKARYKALADAEPAPNASEADGSGGKMELVIKSDVAFDKLVKSLTAEAVKALVSDLAQGEKSLAVTKVGKLTAGEPDAKGVVAISFKPFKTKPTDEA
jgi:hypothetical protein